MTSTTTKFTTENFRFVLTGFGPFDGVPENPTSILARELPEFLRTCGDANPDAAVLAPCTETMIIETSVEAVTREIKALQERLTQPGQSAIVLHLGVDASSERFHLERCAYNDASFRVPDEKGYQPTRAPILDTCPLGSTLTTSFDVPALVDLLNRTVSTTLEGPPLANPSTDPGRFVCNYIYCTSMDAFQCAKTIVDEDQSEVIVAVAANEETKLPRVQTLFLHVPPFSVIPKEEQLMFVARLMGALLEQKMGTVEVDT